MPININKRSDVNSVNGKVGDVVLNASDVGLSNVPNVATNDQTPTFTESTTLTKLTSGEKLSVAFGKISKSITDLINHIANKNNPHEVTKTQVGLGNVDNTADANKSVKNADKLYNKSNDYYGVWLGGMTIQKGTEAGMSQSVAEDPLHHYIKPTSIIDIYYADDSVQYASEIGMLYNIQESGGVYYLSIAPKKDVTKQDIVIQNILVRNP